MKRIGLGLAIAVLVLFLEGRIPQQLTHAQASPGNVSPCYHQEFSEFSFLEGDWEVKLNSRLGDGKWEETTATSQIKRDLSGCILIERLLGSREDRPFHVLSLFAFDNNSKRLQYLLSDSEHGLLALYQGRKLGGEILLDLELVRDDGSKVTVRRSYSEIKKDSFSLESKHSRDGGKSWLTVMRAHYRRSRKSP